MTQTYLSTRNGHFAGKPSASFNGGVFPSLHTLYGGSQPEVSVFPEISMTRSADAIRVTASVPGVEKEEIELTIEDRDLTISGSRVLAVSEENVLAEERFFGDFKRVIKLPEAVELEEIQATHEDGLLTVILPRLKTDPRTTIEIQ